MHKPVNQTNKQNKTYLMRYGDGISTSKKHFFETHPGKMPALTFLVESDFLMFQSGFPPLLSAIAGLYIIPEQRGPSIADFSRISPQAV